MPEGRASSSQQPAEPDWAPLSMQVYPWVIMVVRVYTRTMGERNVLNHRVLTHEEQVDYHRKAPRERPPEPPSFSLGALGQGKAAPMAPDRKLFAEIEAKAQGYQASLAHHQALAAERIRPFNQVEREVAWTPLTSHHWRSEKARTYASEGAIVILCSPSVANRFFTSSGLVLLQGMTLIGSGPFGPTWSVDSSRFIPLVAPFLRPQVFLPLSQLPTFPITGTGQRFDLLNETFRIGGLWTVVELQDGYDPIRDGV